MIKINKSGNKIVLLPAIPPEPKSLEELKAEMKRRRQDPNYPVPCCGQKDEPDSLTPAGEEWRPSSSAPSTVPPSRP